MADFLLRLEAVNMGASIFDTDDLSTIRGGGIANLLLPGLLLQEVGSGVHALGRCEMIFQGASQAEAVLTADKDVDQERIEATLDGLISGRLKAAGLPSAVEATLPFLPMIGVAVPFDGDYMAASGRALGRLRRLQLQRPTLDFIPLSGASRKDRPCDLDRVRPATQKLQVGTDTFSVSDSVFHRRTLGRTLRQAVYDRVLGGRAPKNVTFAESFADLVEEQPGLPPSLTGKIAVIHMDGNSFTALRASYLQGSKNAAEAAKAFADHVEGRRADLLADMLQRFIADPRMTTPSGKLRFETLMWGGDEAEFVLPAWKIMDLIDLFADVFPDRGWTLDNGQSLSHGIGILLCHHKMPIATARSLAEKLARNAKGAVKGALDNVLDLQIIESIEPDSDGLPLLRSKLYGASVSTATLPLVGAGAWKAFTRTGRILSDPVRGFPRSQLYGLLRKGNLNKGAEISAQDYLDALDTAVRRSLPMMEDGEAQGFVRDRLSQMTGGIFCKAPSAPWLEGMRLAEFWDCFRPFASQDRHTATEVI